MLLKDDIGKEDTCCNVLLVWGYHRTSPLRSETRWFPLFHHCTRCQQKHPAQDAPELL